MGTMDMPAAGAPAYASPRGARSESGRSTYSRRSRSARAAAAADENMPASRFIYVEASYRKYCEALAWAKEQVLRNLLTPSQASVQCSAKWGVQVSAAALRVATQGVTIPGMSPDPSRLRESTGMADIDQFIRACTPGTGLRVGPVFPPDPPVSWSSKPRPATARRPGERFVPLELPPRPSTAMVGGRPWKPFGEYGPKPMQQRPQSARPHTPGQFSRGSAHYM